MVEPETSKQTVYRMWEGWELSLKDIFASRDVGRILDSLKPCPFCGGKAGRRFRAESVESPFECIIECADCGASLEVIDTANDLEITQNLAIDKWNTRI